MPLIRNAEQVEDRYLRVADDAPVPQEGAVLLPAARFLADADHVLRRSGAIGVIWPNNRDIAELLPYLDRLSLVALVFPAFKDGRAYSQARTLRERFNFRGELRATGDVLRDQFLFMHRAGFDAFEVRKPKDAQAFCEALKRYNLFYQPASDREISVPRRRLGTGLRRIAAVAELAQ